MPRTKRVSENDIAINGQQEEKEPTGREDRKKTEKKHTLNSEQFMTFPEHEMVSAKSHYTIHEDLRAEEAFNFRTAQILLQ